MGFWDDFLGKSSIEGHIDRSTGRNKRDKSPVNDRKGKRPQRSNGKIVRKGRLEFQRAKNGRTDVKQQSWWW